MLKLLTYLRDERYPDGTYRPREINDIASHLRLSVTWTRAILTALRHLGAVRTVVGPAGHERWTITANNFTV